LDVNARLLDLVHLAELDEARVIGAFLTPAPPPSLSADDYPHLAAELGAAQRLLRGALACGRRGVNLLLWGATGTGKTELARLLAAAVGAPLHIAGAVDEDG